MIKKKIECISFALITGIVILSFLSCSCNLSDTHQDALEYLRQFEDNPNIVYVDNGNIYFGNERIVFYDEEIDGYTVRDILYISQKSVYFYAESQKNTNIYVCDHNFENVEKIYSIEKAESIDMYSENEIRFSKNEEKYLYIINEKRMVKVDEFPAIKREYEFRIIDKIGYKNDKIEITKNQTGEKKTIKLTEILDIDQAKQLKKITGYFDIDSVSQSNEKLYISCVSNFIVTTYSFDFESETISFADWSEAYGSVSVYII